MTYPGPTQDRVCGVCTNNTFKVAPNANYAGTRPVHPTDGWDWDKCLAHAPNGCPAGNYLSKAPNKIEDLKCLACPNGKYNPSATRSNATVACKDWTQGTSNGCPKGMEETVEGTPTVDQKCKSCLTGWYNNIGPSRPGAAAVCNQCTTCPAGKYVTTACTNTTNRVCTDCPGAGAVEQPSTYTKYSYTNGTNKASCMDQPACAAGTSDPHETYKDQTKERTCTPCEAGSYQGATGMSPKLCIPCNKGTYADTAGSSQCKLCPFGYYQNALNQTSCALCAPRHYTSTKAATVCDLVSNDTHFIDLQRVSVGSEPDPVMKPRAICAVNHYATQGHGNPFNTTSCAKCADNHISKGYENLRNLISCTPCGTNEFRTDDTKAECSSRVACPANEMDVCTDTGFSCCMSATKARELIACHVPGCCTRSAAACTGLLPSNVRFKSVTPTNTNPNVFETYDNVPDKARGFHLKSCATLKREYEERSKRAGPSTCPA